MLRHILEHVKKWLDDWLAVNFFKRLLKLFDVRDENFRVIGIEHVYMYMSYVRLLRIVSEQFVI